MIYVKKIQIPSQPTREPRRLYVSLPRDYARTETRYPVLYMFDGHNVFYDSDATYGKSWGMKEYLARTRLPLIVVAVACNPEGDRRLHEYAPWNFEILPEYGSELPTGTFRGEGKRTMQWMTQVLKPEIDRKYRTLPDRAHTLIGGSSMGGLMALYAVTACNKVYSRAAVLSPSLWAGGDNLRRLLERTKLAQPTRIWMDLGTGELDGREELVPLFEAAAALSRNGADCAVRVVPGAVHNEAAWEKRIPLFMDYLLSEPAPV